MAFNFKKILITGAKGQLAHSFYSQLSDFSSTEILRPDKNELNIGDEIAISEFFAKHPDIDLCINCAAYTKVDLAENEVDLAYAINAKGPGFLAETCNQYGAVIIHFSSDYVYHNQLTQPLRESDDLAPKSIYAKSKLEGEKKVASKNPKHFIFRTSWLYNHNGQNFLTTMYRLGSTKKELTIVSDQIGTPTYTFDLAGAVIEILSNERNLTKNHFGIYNYSNSGVTHWQAFAQEIFRLSNQTVNCLSTSTEAYGAPAPRPKYSILSHRKLQDKFNIYPRNWKVALKDCMIKGGMISN